MPGASDPFDLERFVVAQAASYTDALAELEAGRKRRHWMWFIFPQLAGLGRSETARFFGIRSADEARAYLAHPLLGPRLRACCAALLRHRGAAAEAILGSIDALKLRSSMTLFEAVADDPAAFAAVLDGFYQGMRDRMTLDLLRRE
ncbi:hypothetical protein SCH01S_45_00190 [Sphingomonas changbaiensis NBRC 104936]|uniref:Calpastatin n=1 Tax=Sphingomonas changbaiensis NBRC 104936 TaxID=1219043 RepID=A0A0E9MRX2_9SPHN|nr:DUF1810 domain-containing protein [Sphingomonas changbaiensis]GAO40176.1 hypothetical protein SCH01S_45_00190 [Sphingomonas changbaiensis NBRC 104936]